MSWRKHVEGRHPEWSEELDSLTASGRSTSIATFHDWVHQEYAAQLDHRHDDHGQLIELRPRLTEAEYWEAMQRTMNDATDRLNDALDLPEGVEVGWFPISTDSAGS